MARLNTHNVLTKKCLMIGKPHWFILDVKFEISCLKQNFCKVTLLHLNWEDKGTFWFFAILRFWSFLTLLLCKFWHGYYVTLHLKDHMNLFICCQIWWFTYQIVNSAKLIKSQRVISLSRNVLKLGKYCCFSKKTYVLPQKTWRDDSKTTLTNFPFEFLLSIHFISWQVLTCPT